MEQTTIKLKRKNLTNQKFFEAMQKITNTPFEPKVSYQLKKIVDEINAVMKDNRVKFREILKDYVEMDEQGNPKTANGAMGEFVFLEGKEEAFHKAEKEFGETFFEISRTPVPASSLGASFKLSAAEIEVLDGIIDFSNFDKSSPNMEALAEVAGAQVHQLIK